MKVLLYFENEQSLKKSGIGRALRHQIKACEENGIDYTLDPSDTYDIAHINTYFHKSSKLLKKCRKNNIPVIVHGHSTFEDFKDSFVCWKLMSIYFYTKLKFMYKNADLIITPTKYSKDLIDSYGYKTPVLALSNGINLEEYERNEESIKLYKEFFNIKDNEKVIIGVGLPFKRKGLHDFFEVARKNKDTKFIWFGHLNKLLVSHFIKKEIKNKPNNVIMPGYIDGKIIKGAFQAADATLFPSYEETEGIVCLESLASKCHLIIRDIGVYADWLKDGVNCYKGNSNDDFDCIIKNKIPSRDETLISNGYEIAKERSISNVGKQLKSIYEKVLNKYKVNKKDNTQKISLEIVRFIVVGIIATIFDFGVVSLVGLVLPETLNTSIISLITITCGFTVGVIINYILSTLWIYKNVEKDVNVKSCKNIVLFVILSAIGLFIGIGIWQGATIICSNYLNIPDINKWLEGIFTDAFSWSTAFWFTFFFGIKTLIVLFWNYISRKKIIYKSPKVEHLTKEDF